MNTQKIMAWLDEEMDMAYTVKELSDATGTGFKPLYLSPPKQEIEQESVAWKCECGANLFIDEAGNPCSKAPPKREWVDLTETEAAECWTSSTINTWKRIQAKLKEKNNG
jgi:hypothetical protein